MIWKKCLLKAHEKVGEDALKNPIYEWKIVMKTKARFTPWTDEQIALDDRDVTKNEQAGLSSRFRGIASLSAREL